MFNREHSIGCRVFVNCFPERCSFIAWWACICRTSSGSCAVQGHHKRDTVWITHTLQRVILYIYIVHIPGCYRRFTFTFTLPVPSWGHFYSVDTVIFTLLVLPTGWHLYSLGLFMGTLSEYERILPVKPTQHKFHYGCRFLVALA
jgi:hypothetical protein